MIIKRNYFLTFLGLVVLSTAIGTTPASAQEPQVAQIVSFDRTEPAAGVSETAADKPAASGSAINAATSLARVGVQTAQPVSISLTEAIRMALQNNNDIAIARDDVLFQEQQLRALLGFYDPTFNVNPTYTRSQTTGNEATSDFRINSDITHFIKPGGGNYRVFFDNSRIENQFAQAQAASGELVTTSGTAIHTSNFGISYTQPLMRNMRVDNTRRNIKIARKRLEQTDADFRQRTIETITQVQRAYWDLVFALRDQQNNVANVNLSRENLRQVEARIEAGAAAPLEKAEVETELANREAALLLATQQVSTVENQLKQLLLQDSNSSIWTQTFVPVDKPVFSMDPVSLDDAMKDAMDNRFELRRLKLAKEINDIDIAYFRNQTKPQIDLNTRFSLQGLSRSGSSTDPFVFPQFQGNDEILRQRLNLLLPPEQQIPNPNVIIPGTPDYLAGGFNRSLANMFRSDAPNLQVGVTISFPLRNRTAKANLAGARVTEQQLDAQMRSQEQTVVVEVRNAVQAVETARQRVLTARRARENAEIQLEGERKLYEVGKSTTFLLFQRENSLTNARNAEIRAETDYNKALADLQRATSTTFRINNIEIESPTDQQ